jgi:hypothetical protein
MRHTSDHRRRRSTVSRSMSGHICTVLTSWALLPLPLTPLSRLRPRHALQLPCTPDMHAALLVGAGTAVGSHIQRGSTGTLDRRWYLLGITRGRRRPEQGDQGRATTIWRPPSSSDRMKIMEDNKPATNGRNARQCGSAWGATGCC